MELMTLTDYANGLQLNDPVENYQSLIWTERFMSNGEFELTTGNVEYMLNALPLDSYVSLRESLVPMVVESHVIKKELRAAPVLTVRGRSFECSALERRWATTTTLSNPPAHTASGLSLFTIPAATRIDAAYRGLRIVLGDVQRYSGGSPIAGLGPIPPVVSPNDAIPEIDLVVPAGYSTATTPTTYELGFTNLYASVMELITQDNWGIKSYRPGPAGTKFGVELYEGTNNTSSVVFDARFDQIDAATYLLSKLASKNVGYVYGATESDIIEKTLGSNAASGMDRRVLGIDLTQDGGGTTPATRTARGLVELYQNNEIAMFDGEVSEQIAAGYNLTYSLGDLITLVGEYGLTKVVRVTEFIRVDDATGSKAYPTLETVPE